LHHGAAAVRREFVWIAQKRVVGIEQICLAAEAPDALESVTY